MVFNATFNNISVISWRSVLLVKETGVPGENHRPVASHWQHLSHNVISSTRPHERDSKPQGTDYISSDQSNYDHDHDGSRHKRPNYCSNIYRELPLLLYIQLLSTNLHVWKRNQALIWDTRTPHIGSSSSIGSSYVVHSFILF
jgi:hypothetical protein